MRKIAAACNKHGKLARGSAETEAQIEEYWRLGCKVLNLPGNDVSTYLDGLKSACQPCTCAAQVHRRADALSARALNRGSRRPHCDTQPIHTFCIRTAAVSRSAELADIDLVDSRPAAATFPMTAVCSGADKANESSQGH